ncbi:MULTISPECIES: hypothetical protein [Commensalibacter]|uniref:hypothetical protein n=1 Tax=Commensalibacter TaxID=1079922 RepID=UPI0012D88B0F|nr:MULTISPECIES: hypothetical protein [Commensalibacter]MCT6842773.1 hypothetical protein [Commensalibacter sp.]MCT6852600.1 hypothetical protein [Commensalibacter sp.]MUG34114.1 hypothetical protein [Commensalibacter sp. ESL0382]MUG77375.1 hypothetical protein [Commensalibacter melissae]
MFCKGLEKPGFAVIHVSSAILTLICRTPPNHIFRFLFEKEIKQQADITTIAVSYISKLMPLQLKEQLCIIHTDHELQ